MITHEQYLRWRRRGGYQDGIKKSALRLCRTDLGGDKDPALVEPAVEARLANLRSLESAATVGHNAHWVDRGERVEETLDTRVQCDFVGEFTLQLAPQFRGAGTRKSARLQRLSAEFQAISISRSVGGADASEQRSDLLDRKPAAQPALEESPQRGVAIDQGIVEIPRDHRDSPLRIHAALVAVLSRKALGKNYAKRTRYPMARIPGESFQPGGFREGLRERDLPPRSRVG